MFDQDDYYSDEQDTVFQSHKAIASSKVLKPSSSSDFNHLTGDSESLLKMMKERGIDLSETEVKKMRIKHNSSEKPAKETKGRSGFFDGGACATIQELIKALNKALSKADPQQASCILSYILERKKLPLEDINKFGIMKCKILFGLGAYKDCEQKAQNLISKANSMLNSAVFSNYLAKCKAMNNKVLEGYIDLLRAKSLIVQIKENQSTEQKQTEAKVKQITQKSQSQQTKAESPSEAQLERQKLQADFKESHVDSVTREIDYTQMEYNIKLGEYKNNMNVLYPLFPQFKHRKITQIACGDYHALFLVKGTFDSAQSTLNEEWSTQVFGLGENGVGQLLGKSTPTIYKQPVLITQLSGKGIQGIHAHKETSLAFNSKGQVFQWGVKQARDDKISVTFSVGEQIQSLKKGNKHYALLTKSSKFYTWGSIESRGSVIYKQASPHMQQSANIVDFSCGNSCITCVDKNGEAFGLGNNEFGQLALPGQFFSKAFKKIPVNNTIGSVKKIVCLGDCTFYVNEDDEIFFTGRYSFNKPTQQTLRQAEFSGQVRNLISISGHTGTYYATNQIGEVYQWSVDSNVKFRLNKQNQQFSQRYLVSNRGTLFRVKSLIQPEYCSVRQVSKNPQSYEEIQFELQLRDRMGLYGNKNMFVSPRCQIFLSTYELTDEELKKQNKDFLQRYKLSTSENRIILSQIVEPRLQSYKIIRNQQEPWLNNLSIVVDTAGKYYFYVILEESVLYKNQLYIEVSAQERQMGTKSVEDKKAKQQERRRKLQQQRRRLLQEKRRKEDEQEQKRKETQKRAEDALKKHMKEQQQAKMKEIEDRRARKQLQTGGGFDLNKLAKKKSSESSSIVRHQQKPQMERTTESFMRSTESFLPDINVRPSSKRKLTMKRESVDSKKNINPLQKTAGFTNDSKGFLQSKTKQMGKGLGDFKNKEIGKNMGDSFGTANKQLNRTVGGTGTGTKTTLLKRGLSRKK